MSVSAERLRAALGELLPADEVPRDLRWRTLAGGVNARSVHVELAGREWVVRLPHRGAASLLDVATEARVMAAAAQAGLAPRVVAASAGGSVLATEYVVNARPWSPEDARSVRNIDRIASLLRGLHGVAVAAPHYRAVAIAEGYVGDPAIESARADMRTRQWAGELLDLARRYDASYQPSVLTHNDLVAANVLDDGSLKLVDFEYAVRSAPILDLAGLAAMNDYSVAQCDELLAAYYRDVVRPISFDDLAEVMRMLRLMSFFWARIGAARAADPVAYWRVAEDMIEKLK